MSDRFTGISNKERIYVKIEALKAIKQWSHALIIIQTSGLAVIAAILTRGGMISECHEKITSIRVMLLMLLVSTLMYSMSVGIICVYGAVPHVMQKICNNAYIDIYSVRSGLKIIEMKNVPVLIHVRDFFMKVMYMGLRDKSLGEVCIWQSITFSISLLLFVLFIISESVHHWMV